MEDKKFIFISGLHRSGTSLFYKILNEQENFSGLTNTNEIEDEGQFVQSVYLPAYKFGGVGKFGFNEESQLNETSILINEKNRQKLFKEWSRFWNTEKKYLVEKSPPNIIRTRFLQEMFPNSYFINITRHPIATSLATKKWSKTSLDSLIDHWIVCHKIFNKYKKNLIRSINFKYEDLIDNPEKILKTISNFLKIKIINSDIEIRKGINQKYFKIWEKKKNSFFSKNNIKKIIEKYENEVNNFGYSLIDY
jgi:hypothetical protein